jgi:C4-dicarboxylate-specific signal transduction histidine kinase
MNHGLAQAAIGNVDAVVALDDDAAAPAELLRRCMASGMGLFLSHELSQPLYAIANYAGAGLKRLERRHGSLDAVAEDLRNIKTQTQRAAQLIQCLRNNIGRGFGQAQRGSLNALVVSAGEAFDCVAHHHGVKIVLALNEELPPVLADKARLQCVMFNLLQNGVDSILAAGEGAGAITVATSLLANDTAGGALCVTVRDNGTGVSADAAERLFEPFYTTKAHGLGIGLTVSRALVEAQGGRLWFEPAMHAGIAHFTLPAAA